MRKTKTTLVVTALLALCSFSALAATDTAPTVDIATLKNAAMHGDADAAFSLCNAYYNGRGVQKDEAESDKWCKQSSQIIAQKTAEPLSHIAPAR